MKRALLMVAMTAALSGQTAPTATTRLYGSYSEATPSGAAVVVTIQQPSTGARQVQFEGAVVYCSVACVPSLEINGTAATATAGTVIKLDTRAPTATAAVFTGSDVGAGTVINRYPIAAGGQTDILKSGLTLGVSTGVRQNLTIRTDAISGNVHILLMWSEPQ
jgi:hypothetical protein